TASHGSYRLSQEPVTVLIATTAPATNLIVQGGAGGGGAGGARASELRQFNRIKSTPSPVVQEGRLLFEAGKLAQAEAKLNEALKQDPESTAARYYLNLIDSER